MYYTVQILETLSVFWVSLIFLFCFFCNAVAGRRDSHQTRVLTHFLLPPFVPFYWWFGVLAVGGGGGGRWGRCCTDRRFSPKEEAEMSMFVWWKLMEAQL